MGKTSESVRATLMASGVAAAVDHVRQVDAVPGQPRCNCCGEIRE
ncbi:MAG: hypothetical protein R3D69_07055 [Xanthobacteraceae bacterium]